MASSLASAEGKTRSAEAEEVAANVKGGTSGMSSKAERMWSKGTLPGMR
jgi:hypothetical protein